MFDPDSNPPGGLVDLADIRPEHLPPVKTDEDLIGLLETVLIETPPPTSYDEAGDLARRLAETATSYTALAAARDRAAAPNTPVTTEGIAVTLEHEIALASAIGDLPDTFHYVVDVVADRDVERQLTAPVRITAVANEVVSVDQADAADESLESIAYSATPENGRRLWQVEVDTTPPALPGEDLTGVDLRPWPLAFTNLANRDLRGATLADMDLTGINLRGSDLSDANLHGADLRDAQLRDAVVVRGDASRAELAHAELQGADLTGADLRDATMVGADLRRADLTDADLSQARLASADLRHANLLGRPNFAGADLRGAVLSDQRLHGVDFTDADLRDADFTRSVFSDCTFTGAQVTGARIEHGGRHQMAQGGAVATEPMLGAPVPPAPVAPLPVRQPAFAGPRP